MNKSYYYAALMAAGMLVCGCSSQPEYAGRKVMPYTQQFEILGSPKKIVTTEYFAEDYPAGKYTYRQELELSPEGYVARGTTENEANIRNFEYKYTAEPFVQYEEVRNTTTFKMDGSKEESVTQYVVDDKGNFVKGLVTVDGKPEVEHVYKVDGQGYPVEHTVYKYGQSGGNFDQKEVNVYKDGLKVETKIYYPENKNPNSVQKVKDDGVYQLYKILEIVNYDKEGKPVRFTRFNYDSDMRPIVDESSVDGNEWTVDREYVYDAKGNLTEQVSHTSRGDKAYKYKYEYDSHGNWTKKDDGNVITVREITY